MKRRFIVFFFLPIILSCNYHENAPKIDHHYSRSITASQEAGMFIDHFRLIPQEEDCPLDTIRNCWLEFAYRTQYRFAFKTGTEKMGFYNLFIPEPDSLGSPYLYYQVLGKKHVERNASLLIEPPLGYCFQIDTSLILDSLIFYYRGYSLILAN